jgi:hypothetical protein
MSEKDMQAEDLFDRLSEDHLYDMHAVFVLEHAKRLGLVEYGADYRLTDRGRAALALAYARGWTPDWRVMKLRLAANYDGPEDVLEGLAKKLNEFRLIADGEQP